MKTLICDCNRTMPLDAKALGLALRQAPGAATEAPDAVHSTLCRREASAFQQAARSGEDLLVACTQESRLFLELAEQTAGAPGLQERPIRFVNIRETGGWSKDAHAATPKIAALIAAAQLPAAEPVAAVTYTQRRALPDRRRGRRGRKRCGHAGRCDRGHRAGRRAARARCRSGTTWPCTPAH